jgi:hypothetical protein
LLVGLVASVDAAAARARIAAAGDGRRMDASLRSKGGATLPRKASRRRTDISPRCGASTSDASSRTTAAELAKACVSGEGDASMIVCTSASNA